MSSNPIRCPNCRTAIIAKARDTQANKRLRAMPDLGYGEPSSRPGWVRVLCPVCSEPFDVRGRLIIELTAA